MLPIVKELAYQNPQDILLHFAEEEWLCFFDSAKELTDLGVFSFIVFNPFLKIVSKNSQTYLNGVLTEGDPFHILQQQLLRYKIVTQPELPPFQGGAAGYFSYDLLHYLENVPRHAFDVMKFPEMAVGFYDTVIAFDHQAKRAWAIAHGFVEDNFVQQKALENCEAIIKKLSEKINIPAVKKWSIKNPQAIKSNFTQEKYSKTVQKVIDYIYAGDIFQANVSQCFSCDLPLEVTALNLYLKLREKNPAPFAAFLHYGDFSIASASPERFIKLANRKIEARPIKGTRPRGNDEVEDEKLAKELLASEKDQAENVMIVDLMRNDLSRVCLDHSVVVKKLCGLETYATVHHLVSSIGAELKPECDAVDVLRSTFPGGSITGAPKVRVMEIIAELEPTVRGPYCGSIGYIGFDGAMDTSIVIRTFSIKGNKVTFQTGGGIVADSSPDMEYQETLIKAAALFKVLVDE